MSKGKFDFRKFDFDDLEDYEYEEQIKNPHKNSKNIPAKHLKKVQSIDEPIDIKK